MALGDIIKIKFESIASGGDALGKLDGKTIFTAGGAPFDLALCRITEERNTWSKAEILEIQEPSPFRVNADCGYYIKCGGCNLMHIEYDAQLNIKTSILKEQLLRSTGTKPPDIEVFPSPPYEYRNRMQFHCLRQAAEGENFKFGLKGKGTNEIIAISDCHIANPGIRKVLKDTASFSKPIEKDRFTVFAYNDVFLSEGGQGRGKIKLLNKEITLDAGVFFQSNCFMLEKLIIELGKIGENADTNLPMADLYCGVGTFAFFLSGSFPKVILAEENKSAIALARENLRGINAEFFALRDSEWYKEGNRGQGSGTKKKGAFISGEAFGFAVLDPPRAGLNIKFAKALAENGPKIIAYVSCDASSLARDSKILQGGGYMLKELKLFDFYPHTAHIESLAVFKKP